MQDVVAGVLIGDERSTTDGPRRHPSNAGHVKRRKSGPNATCLRCTARVLLLVWTLITGGSNQCGCIEGGFKRIATEASRTTRQAVAAGVHPYLGQNQCHRLVE